MFAAYESPASIELRLDCELELHIDDGESDALRYAGMVRADMTEGDVILAVGFLGVVELETGKVVASAQSFRVSRPQSGSWRCDSVRCGHSAVRCGRQRVARDRGLMDGAKEPCTSTPSS